MNMEPTKCPKCGSDNVEFFENEWSFDHYAQGGYCLSCECSWTDIFELHDRVIDEEE